MDKRKHTKKMSNLIAVYVIVIKDHYYEKHNGKLVNTMYSKTSIHTWKVR